MVFSFLVATNAAVFGALHTVHHLDSASWGVVWVLATVCGVSLCFPPALRAGVSERVLVPTFMAFFLTAVVAVASLDGGMDSGATFWLVVTPLAGAFIGGARLGRTVGAASMVAGGAMFGASTLGWTFPTALSPEDARLHFALNFVSAAPLAGALAALYEGPMVRHLRQTLTQLAEVNGELRVELAERRQAQSHAERASRAKDSLLSNMSHEFRTPLTAILGYADLLATEVDDDQQPLVAAVERGGHRLLNTLDGVLELSWIETGGSGLPSRPTDLGGLARDAAEGVWPEAETRGVAIRVTGTAEVHADAMAVRRVLGAVLHNAVRFTPQGSVAVTVSRDGAWGVVRIADTGIGMPADFVEAAVEPFRQASEGEARTAEGTGLGLTVAHRLATQMGGGLHIESALGAGTTVTVRLPATTETCTPGGPARVGGDGAADARPPVLAGALWERGA